MNLAQGQETMIWVWLTVSQHHPPCGQCHPLRGRGCRGSGCWTWGGSPHRCGANGKGLSQALITDNHILNRLKTDFSIPSLWWSSSNEERWIICIRGKPCVDPSRFCMNVRVSEKPAGAELFLHISMRALHFKTPNVLSVSILAPGQTRGDITQRIEYVLCTCDGLFLGSPREAKLYNSFYLMRNVTATVPIAERSSSFFYGRVCSHV